MLKILYGDITEIFTVIDSEKIIRASSTKLKFFTIIQYYHLLGVAYFNLGEYERALEEFTIALKECQLRDMERNASEYTNKKTASE